MAGIEVFVNGESQRIEEGATLATAIETLGLAEARVAVALNETFVPRQEYGERRLEPGDRIDLVTRIEGG